MLSPNPDQPVNLTAAVDLAGLLKGRGVTQVLTGGGLTFGIHGPDGLEAVPERSEADNPLRDHRGLWCPVLFGRGADRVHGRGCDVRAGRSGAPP